MVLSCDSFGITDKEISIAVGMIEQIYTYGNFFDVNVENKVGMTILDLAASSSRRAFKLIPMLLTRDFKEVNKAFYMIMKKGDHLDVAQELMNHFSFKGSLAINDQYPLMQACSNLAIEIVEALVKRTDVDAKVVDGNGNTALHHLILSFKIITLSDTATASSIVNLIYKYAQNVNVNIKNSSGQTILDAAAVSLPNYSARLLISTLLQKPFVDMNPAIQNSICNFNHSLLSLILENYTGDIGAVSIESQTPLQFILQHAPLDEAKAKTIHLLLPRFYENVVVTRSYFGIIFEEFLGSPYLHYLLGQQGQVISGGISWDGFARLLDASFKVSSVGWLLSLLFWLWNHQEHEMQMIGYLDNFRNFILDLVSFWINRDPLGSLSRCMEIFDAHDSIQAIMGKILDLEVNLSKVAFVEEHISSEFAAALFQSSLGNKDILDDPIARDRCDSYLMAKRQKVHHQYNERITSRLQNDVNNLSLNVPKLVLQ